MSLSFSTGLSFDSFQHGYTYTMFAMWAIGVDIPRLLQRYGKSYPATMNVHAICMMIIGLTTIMYVLAQIIMYSKEPATTSTKPQFSGAFQAQYILSIILSVLIIVQFCLGFATRGEMNKQTLSKHFFRLKKVHKLNGFFLSILGKVIVSLILSYSTDNTTLKAWFFSIAGIIALWIILQVIYSSQTRSIALTFPLKHRNKHWKKHQQILQNINKKITSFENYSSLGIRYVILDNCMYYIDQDFMHPGGQYVFHVLNGKQINYYLKGGRSVGLSYPTHNHTKYVMKYLENRVIGEIEAETILTSQKMADQLIQWRTHANYKSEYTGANVIQFETDAGYVRQGLKAENFGKYVMMSCQSEQMLSRAQRPFFLLSCLSQYQKTQLDKLKKAYKYYYSSQIDKSPQKQGKETTHLSTIISFFVKDSKTDEFTRFMLTSPKDRSFNITGLYGTGLSLKPKSQGYYIFVVGGMGILAFADLFTYLLQKQLLQLVQDKSSPATASKLIDQQQNYDQLNNLRILLLCSFQSPKHFYFDSLLKQLYFLCKRHNLKRFDMMLRFDSNDSEPQIKMVRDKFDDLEFMKKIVESQEPDRMYFCGPVALENGIRTIEPKLKLKSSIFYI